VQLETALEMYKIDNSRYPTSEQGLEALLRKPTAAPEPRRYPPDGYLKRRDSLNDAWDATFQYESPGHHNTRRFDLWSLGADETPGGEETDRDIGNWDDPASSGS
jgi:general secretion pathway protein G